MSVALTSPCRPVRTLDQISAAQYLGFLPRVFDEWVAAGLLPKASVEDQFWLAADLDRAIQRLEAVGFEYVPNRKPSNYVALPNVHRTFVTKADETRSYHYRRRGLRGPIYGEPNSPSFMRALIAKERGLAAVHPALQPRPATAPRAPPPIAHDDEQDEPPNTPSDAVLHMGGVAPSDQQLPLYPSELEIGRAVLGTDRAHEWPALAALLEREGLPVADPVFQARFWPAVQKFFEERHGLDGGLAVHKHAQIPNQRSRISVSKLQVATQLDPSNSADQDNLLFTAEELVARWRGALSLETLANWRSQTVGIGPAFVKIGRTVLYPFDAVIAFEQQRRFPKPAR